MQAAKRERYSMVNLVIGRACEIYSTHLNRRTALAQLTLLSKTTACGIGRYFLAIAPTPCANSRISFNFIFSIVGYIYGPRSGDISLSPRFDRRVLTYRIGGMQCAGTGAYYAFAVADISFKIAASVLSA
jgi:hypothetical protein